MIRVTRSLLSLAILLSGCASVPPDSVPWLLHRKEVERAPWWGKPRLSLETSGMLLARSGDDSHADAKGGLVMTPAAQSAVGIPFGNHLGLDATFGLLPTDFKAALPVSGDRFVIYPFLALGFRDSTLLPRREWRCDPGLELAYLVHPEWAVKLTAGTVRSLPFSWSTSAPHSVYAADAPKAPYLAFTAERIDQDPAGAILGQATLGISTRPGGAVSFFVRLGLAVSTTPAKFL